MAANETALRYVLSAACVIAAASSVGCGDVVRGFIGEQCDRNSDCDAPLVCRIGRCRKECATSADCTIGLSCVVDDDGFGACQLDSEIECTVDTDCIAPLVCRGDAVNRQCTNECRTDEDCLTGARCLPAPEPGVDTPRGCIDEAASEPFCVYDGDCDPGMYCLASRCRRQCYANRDCLRDGWICRSGPGYGICCDETRAPSDPMSCRAPLPFDAGAGMDGGAGTDGGAGMDSGTGMDSGSGMDGGVGSDGGMRIDAGPPACSGSPLTGVRQLAVGGVFACVLRGTGPTSEVLCWGNHGDIGLPGGELSSVCPVAVPALTGLDIVQVEAGGGQACAVLGTGEVYCWGSNFNGELGRGTTSASEPPGLVPGVTADGVTTSWTNTCVWRAGTAAQCWGSNLWGTVGNSATTLACCACGITTDPADRGPFTTPQTVSCVAMPQNLSVAGGGHVCGIVGGAVDCWGKSGEGQLGTGGGTVIDDAVDVASGNAFSCAVRGGDGTVQCWGENFYGTLGDGTTTARNSRAPVVGLPGAAAQVDAENHACVTLASGAVYCWGDGRLGAVHPSMDTNVIPTPQLVIASGANRVETGARNTCAQVGDQVRCWGRELGQLGNGVSIVTVME